jgi:hypothetical protein
VHGNALTPKVEVGMTSSVLYRSGHQPTRDSASEIVSEIAASIAARLERSRNGGVSLDEAHQGSISIVRDESGNSDCLGENATLKLDIARQMPPDQLSHATPTADEYRARADVCLNWAREALTDEARLACMILAQTWLKAAIRDGDDGPGPLPLAPSL